MFAIPENLKPEDHKQKKVDDILSTASERTMARLEKLRADHEKDHDLREGRSNRIADIDNKRNRAITELRLNEDAWARGGNGQKPTKIVRKKDEATGEYKEFSVPDDQFDRARETIKALTVQRNELHEQNRVPPDGFLHRVIDRLSELPPGTQLQDRKLQSAPKPKPGQHEGDVAADLYEEHVHMAAENDEMWKRQQPFEDWWPAVEAELRRIAKAGAPKFGGFAAGMTYGRHNRRMIAPIEGARIGWPTIDYHRITGTPLEIQDGIAALLWTFEEEFIAKAKAKAEADLAGKKTISLDEKRKLIPTMQEKLWNHSQLLYEAVEVARACGKPARHWPRVRTEIILGVEPFTDDDFLPYEEPY